MNKEQVVQTLDELPEFFKSRGLAPGEAIFVMASMIAISLAASWTVGLPDNPQFEKLQDTLAHQNMMTLMEVLEDMRTKSERVISDAVDPLKN